MQLDKLTIKSQEALTESQRIAHEHSHQAVDCEHLLLALMEQDESLVPELLEKIGVPVATIVTPSSFIMTPDSTFTTSSSRRCVVNLDWPGLRLSM